MSNVQKTISDFLNDSEALLQNPEQLTEETTLELYNMLIICKKTFTENQETLDVELRVRICQQIDFLLDHIVETIPFSINAEVNIYTPAIQSHRRWHNVELMKDKGLIGYTLAKEIGAKPIMFFCDENESYDYAKELPDLELIYTDKETGMKRPYYNFLRENYEKMDILILNGIYFETIEFLSEYRKLRPDGKVFCGLDMSLLWFGRMEWHHPMVQKCASECDFIATSCRHVRDVLNRYKDVNFCCHYFPNGFYNPQNLPIIAEAKQKENIILSVGRIGTEAKNNEELLEAFARIADKIPSWSVRLVGSIDPRFQPYIEAYFTKYPHLKERVVLTGAIYEKASLYEEYKKAKIFALTSPKEGGTPNVYAEALFHGCMFATSNIDASDDITNNGELGISYTLGNIDELAEALLSLCEKSETDHLETHIEQAISYAKKYYDWETNAKKLAFALTYLP
ncbi:MAG: glycosyltransferase [Bacillota bacterium]